MFGHACHLPPSYTFNINLGQDLPASNMGARLAKPAVESPTARLTSLAHEIEDRTKVLTTYLNAKGLEAPSLAVGGVSDFPLAGADESVRRAREDLVSLTQELRDLALGPRASLKSLGWEVRFPLTSTCTY